MAKNKEVGRHPRMGSREDSFGGAPGSIAVGGGKMELFGHKVGEGVWPPAPISVDQKTGYPKGFDQKSAKKIKA